MYVFYILIKVPLGILFKNENVTEEMVEILKKFRSYLPFLMENGNKKYVNQLCAGDQLSVERAVNIIHSVSDGYTPEDRLEGFNIQIGDWHTGVKILEVKFDFLLSTFSNAFLLHFLVPAFCGTHNCCFFNKSHHNVYVTNLGQILKAILVLI